MSVFSIDCAALSTTTCKFCRPLTTTARMSFVLLFCWLGFVSGQIVLNRIQTTTLGFADEVCGNLTTFPSTQFEGCAGVDFSSVPNAPCIPVGQTNCLVNGRVSAFTNFTSDDVELPFNWLCSADRGCGITTEDTNSSGGFLGAFNGSTTFGSSGTVVGFVNAAQSMTRKLRQGGALVIDKRVEYVFSFDFCFANATTAPQTVSLEIDIANATAVVVNNFASTSVAVPANNAESTCGSLTLRIPHYALFPHIGINGFAVTIANSGNARVFIDNFLIEALPVISNDEGDTCQFLPTVVTTVAPPGTPPCTRVFINEINYINVTFDGMSLNPTEAIEIAGPAGTVLTDMMIVLINFVNGDPTPLRTSIVMSDLQGPVTIPEAPESPGFGFVRVAFSQGLPDGMDGIGVDGVALFQRETDLAPIQFICFGPNANGTDFPMSPFPCSSVIDLNNLALNDSTNPGSVHLAGCGNCYEDFDWSFSDPATLVNASGFPFINTRQSFCRDQDADGYWESPCCGGNDCNDLHSFIFPGAFEICDGEQTNCIGPAVTEDDLDGDGRLSCDGDCNDNDNTTFGLAQFFVNGSIAASASNCVAVPLSVNNSQLEQCDMLDNDCDGLVNEAFVLLFHFRDNDFDGFGDVNASDQDIAEYPGCQAFDGCEVIFPRGWSPNRTDCNDTNANVHPDGNSFCRINDICEDDTSFSAPVDNNCNGVFDEFDFVDLDGDGFANVSASSGNATTCPFHAAAFADEGDCNDGVFAINPNVSEVCNRIDDNCNRVVDEGLFIDLDLDGFGDAATSDPACAAHYRLTDCDDRTNLTLDNEFVGNLSNPSRTEVPCDGLDNDCNPATPDSTAEVCDGIDTDCNCGLYNNPLTLFVPTCIIDDDDAEVRLDNGLVFDNDGDDVLGFADAIAAQCEAVGYVRDCNDNDGLIPGPEECDGVDNDCDRAIDEDFFVDSDGDQWPDNEVNPNDCGGLYNLTADCAPLDRNVNPGVDEEGNDVTFCNNLDDDCNIDTGLGSNGGAGALNENSPDAILFDADGDGFRALTEAARQRCRDLVLVDAFRNQPLDCDDTDPRMRPCRANEFVCLTRVGGVRRIGGAPCAADETRVCGRELITNADGLLVKDQLDNDCNGVTDDLVSTAAHFILTGEFVRDGANDDDDDDDSDDDDSSSSADQFCFDIKVTLKNDSPFNMKDIVIKGQLTLPPKGQLTEYVYGDLTKFGIKVDTRTLRVAWVQFALAKAASQVVTFPVCVRKRDFVVDVELQLQLEDYSVDAAPEPINLQTTVADSAVKITGEL